MQLFSNKRGGKKRDDLSEGRYGTLDKSKTVLYWKKNDLFRLCNELDQKRLGKEIIFLKKAGTKNLKTTFFTETHGTIKRKKINEETQKI